MIQKDLALYMDLRNKIIQPIGMTLTVGSNITFANHAAKFDGADSVNTDIKIENAPVSSLTTWTVVMQVKWDGVCTTARPLFRVGSDNNGSGFSAYIHTDGTLRGVANFVQDFSFDTAMPITGNWVTIAVSWDNNPNTYRLHVDGLFKSSKNWAFGNPPTELHIGRNAASGPTGGFSGLIKEFRLYHRLLTDHEHLELANCLHGDKSNV